ncbi:GolD/DthD family dehydrogenase [Anaerobium acetethylicum]|uniref:NAD(P)-dependent dehydrogenase, short-chain alcohol dehydrogenase family n=1 Tax=Anaerobium acetethylicum TaxID=1619234 RepID=A0A1D3TTU3_9FIRM|nr:D-threitol dehydrogenase [Anaerobium acetethylicum]SCP97424.1 NAD(P)-dependent dehydrogenase, short-chain alcohol dehydrogenase family [Anaerobium acetethylicum]
MLPYYGADTEYSLKGKTAIITGGAAGIGFATAEFFAAKGANLVLADLNPEADKIAKGLGADCIGISGDITDGAYRRKVIEETVARFGGIDILVNSAGIVALDDAEVISESMWDKTMEINLKSTFMMAQAVGKYLIDNKRPGSIVNMASQAGVIALDKHVAYCASKGAIIAMTKVMALEWGEYGIRVNCVSPTVVLTELGKKAWGGPVGDAFKQEMPSKRFAEPDEIAGTIAFLCSGAAGMITGHNLLIDGGFTIK